MHSGAPCRASLEKVAFCRKSQDSEPPVDLPHTDCFEMADESPCLPPRDSTSDSNSERSFSSQSEEASDVWAQAPGGSWTLGTCFGSISGRGEANNAEGLGESPNKNPPDVPPTNSLLPREELSPPAMFLHGTLSARYLPPISNQDGEPRDCTTTTRPDLDEETCNRLISLSPNQDQGTGFLLDKSDGQDAPIANPELEQTADPPATYDDPLVDEILKSKPPGSLAAPYLLWGLCLFSWKKVFG